MSVLERVAGWLAPPNCISCGQEGLSICTGCAATIEAFGERCWRCNRLSPGSRTCDSCRSAGSPGRVVIVANHEGLARSLLSIYKFGQQRAAAAPIARMMADKFIAAPQGLPRNKDYSIVPIPTATTRVRERGFDHTDLLAKNISIRMRRPKINVLSRLDQTRQLGARREERLKQLESSFAVKNPRKVLGRDILLIDDVITTGGTLISAAKTLRAAGAKSVDALLFAKRL